MTGNPEQPKQKYDAGIVRSIDRIDLDRSAQNGAGYYDATKTVKAGDVTWHCKVTVQRANLSAYDQFVRPSAKKIKSVVILPL